MNYELILQNVAKHVQLDKTEEEYFISLLQYRKLKRKEFLLRQGQLNKAESFIIKGCLRKYTVDNNGFEHIVLFGIEDWWMGDPQSFIAQTPSNFFIDALEETEIFQIAKNDLEILYKKVPKFERYFRLLLMNAFSAMQNRINQNLSFTAEQRYEDFVQRYPVMEQRLPRKQVAAYLGITPEFLSMLRRRRAEKKK